MYLNAVKVNKKFLLGGFGKGAILTDVYRIQEFMLVDDNNNSITFHNLYVAVVDRRFSCDIILSYTMFSKCDYGFFNRVEDDTVLMIESSRDIYCSLRLLDEDRSIAKYLTSFFQKER